MLQPGRWHPLLLGPPGLLGGRLPISSDLAQKGPAPPTTFPTPPRGRAIPVEVPLDRRPPPRRMVGRRPVYRASAAGQGALISPNAGGVVSETIIRGVPTHGDPAPGPRSHSGRGSDAAG